MSPKYMYLYDNRTILTFRSLINNSVPKSSDESKIKIADFELVTICIR